MSKTKKQRGIRTPKGYSPADPNKNLFLANHGSKTTGEAVHFFDDCKEFAEMLQMDVKFGDSSNDVYINKYDNPSMTEFGARANNSDDMPKEIGERAAYHLLCAMKTGDGKFFRDLADLCEQGDTNRDNLRSWLIHMHFTAGSGLRPGGKQDAEYSASELVTMAYARGIVSEITDRYMHEVCAELGIKTKDMRGNRGKRRFSK